MRRSRAAVRWRTGVSLKTRMATKLNRVGDSNSPMRRPYLLLEIDHQLIYLLLLRHLGLLILLLVQRLAYLCRGVDFFPRRRRPLEVGGYAESVTPAYRHAASDDRARTLKNRAAVRAAIATHSVLTHEHPKSRDMSPNEGARQAQAKRERLRIWVRVYFQ